MKNLSAVRRRYYSKLNQLVLCVLCCLPSGSLLAEEDIMTIEGARIRGNQELPTILYLIPWQAPVIQHLDAPGQSFAIQRAIAPLERAEFQRLMSYHQHFKSTSSSAEAPAEDSGADLHATQP